RGRSRDPPTRGQLLTRRQRSPGASSEVNEDGAPRNIGAQRGARSKDVAERVRGSKRRHERGEESDSENEGSEEDSKLGDDDNVLISKEEFSRLKKLERVVKTRGRAAVSV